jgi:CrcB protein
LKPGVWLELLCVGAGGFAGSVLRYVTTIAVQRVAHGSEFPFGTLTVNLVGCFAIGALSAFVEARAIPAELRVFLFVGLLGGFTTYSTFAYEGFALWRAGDLVAVFVNIAIHLAVGLAAVWAGHALVAAR